MPIVHPCSLLLENKAFLLQKEKQNIMKTKLLTLFMEIMYQLKANGMTIIIALSLLLLQQYSSTEIY